MTGLDINGNINVDSKLTITGQDIYTSGTESLNIQHTNSGNLHLCNNGGNVGIGLINPSYKLEVAGDISCNNLRTSYVKSNPESGTYIDMNTTPIRFVKSNTEKMRVSNNIEIGQYSVTNLDISGNILISGEGKVGVGTNSPSGRLQINSTNASTNTPEMLTLKNSYNALSLIHI